MSKLDGGIRIADGERATSSRGARSARIALFEFRRGVTLIELLVTITIIATLSTFFLGVSRLAMESAREARTKTLIGKIDGLLMERWNEYATRRVDIDGGVLAGLREQIARTLPANTRRRALGVARTDLQLLATRELMKLEMPDRWSDVGIFPNPQDIVGDADFVPAVLESLPALTWTYRRIGRRILNPSNVNADKLLENQGAECLYLIVMNATGDGEARTLFSEQDFGDTDGDGALEFLDGWGRPISFIRWPAGFVSPLQPIDASGNRLVDSDHDPFDVFRRDLTSIVRELPASLPANDYPASALGDNSIRQAVVAMERRPANRPGAYRLLPLIYSGGSDGTADLVVPDEHITLLDPYAVRNDAGARTDPEQIGQFDVFDNDGENWIDNIHNHLQDGT